jgi:DNA polymerase III alpha subunit
MEFTHLHGHSTFSFLEAIWTPKKLVEKCKELWFSAIWLTDLFSMYWAVKLYESCKENGINPIIWTELWFVLNMTWYNKVEDIWNVCLLATNTEWYQNLMKIVSCANEEWIAWKPKIDIDVIWKNSGWIITFMWWESSWIGKMIYRSESDDKILEIIHMLQDKLWKENVFLEIVAQDENKNQLLWKINKKILWIAEAEWIWVITWNVYNYIEKKDREAWEMALAIKDWKKMFDADRRKPVWDFSLLTWDEIYDILVKNNYSETSIKKWIETNNEIAKKINIEIIMWQALFPVYQTPKDVQELYDNIKDSLISD